jgi:acetyl-CoA C-acetyltransferase
VGDDREGSHPIDWNYGLQMPTQIYPLFEVALRAHEGRASAAHHVHLSCLSASLAAVAATHPHAWFRDGKSADEIGTATAVNRMIAYPYLKYMSSILDVDQAAADTNPSASAFEREEMVGTAGSLCFRMDSRHGFRPSGA